MDQTLERTCRQCEMLESESADFCMDDDGRMVTHNWVDPRDGIIAALRAANERLQVEQDAGLKVIELAREYAKSGVDATLSAQLAEYDDIVQSVRQPRVWQT